MRVYLTFHRTGHGLVVLGKVRACQGLLEDSLELLLKALAQYRGTIGPKHIRVGALCYNLGDTYLKLERSNDAWCVGFTIADMSQRILTMPNCSSMFAEALKIYNERPKEYCAEIARALFGLASAQNRSGLSLEAGGTRVKADACLERLMELHGGAITPAGVDAFIPNWSK